MRSLLIFLILASCCYGQRAGKAAEYAARKAAFHAMKRANGNKPLSPEQLDRLASSRHGAVEQFVSHQATTIEGRAKKKADQRVVNKNIIGYRIPSTPLVTYWNGPLCYGGGSPTRQSGPVYVRGYYRRDGTYVRAHTRSRPRR
jgi:hypothetical protein